MTLSRLDGDTGDSGIASLLLIAQLSGVGINAERVKHLSVLNGNVDAPILVGLAQKMGLKARSFMSQIKRIPQTPLPAIVELDNGRFLVLAKFLNDEVLLHDDARKNTFQMTLAEFEEIWSGRLILITTWTLRAKGTGKFDVSWFIPSIVKYRMKFMEVLLGSFFLQLFGLVSTLFM